LPNSVSPVHCLDIHLRIEIRVVENDMVSCHKVDP
jgi:hypothetical protein